MYFEESTDRGRNWYLEGSLNYDRKFGKHQVGALILYNQWRDQYPDPAQFDYVSIPRGYEVWSDELPIILTIVIWLILT